MNRFLARLETRISLLCGGVCGLIGLGGAAGWILHAPVLIQLVSSQAAMQFNTAVGLVIAGLGLSLAESRKTLAGLSGILTGLLGAATLLEYGLRINLGIDTLLYHPWMAAEVPGRMAVNTAACFLVAGAAMAWTSLLPRSSGRAALFGGYCLVIVAGSALTGYGLDIEVAYRWADQTRMAVLTATAFLVLGAGLCRYGWKRLTLNRTLWLTLLTGGGVAGVSALTWAAVNSAYRKIGAPQAVPDLMLFTGITRACIAAMAVFLWRNSRDKLVQAEGLNHNLRDAVTERNAQLDAIFASIRIGTWSHDLRTDLASFRGRTNEMFGFPPNQSEFSFEEIAQAIYPEDRAGFLEARRAGERGAAVDKEFRVIWPDESIHWLLVQGGVSETIDGKAVCLSGINIDVTRLKNAEIALQRSEAAVRKLNEALERRVRIQTKELVESEKRFRLMVEGLRDYAFFMLDTEGKVVSWNQGAERIMGYTAEQVIGQHFSVLSTEEAIRRGHPEAVLHLAIEHGRHEESGWRVRSDGARFWANVLVTAVYDDAGVLCGFSKVTRDITERKQAREDVEEQKKAGRGSQPREEPLPGVHEPRDPHADERDSGNDGPALGNRAGRGSAPLRGNLPGGPARI